MGLENPSYQDDDIEDFELEGPVSGNGYSNTLKIVAKTEQDPLSFFRSEDMSLCQIFVQPEAAYECMAELGELGLVQFRDLNPDTNVFLRKFVGEVRRCDEMERKLKFIEAEIKKAGGLKMVEDRNWDEKIPEFREIGELEAKLEGLEEELQEINGNAATLKQNFIELTELKHTLQKTQMFFQAQAHAETPAVNGVTNLVDESPASGGAATTGMHFSFVAGVIPRERMPAFEKMLWRACRGNVFLRQAEIEEPIEDPLLGGGELRKSVFMIFFQGEQLKTRVKKICEGFHSTLYPCPEKASERDNMLAGVMKQLDDLNIVISETNAMRKNTLSDAAKMIKLWFIKVRKVKAVFHTLNLLNLDVSQKCLIAEGWIPTADLELIRSALTRGSVKSGSSVVPVLNEMETTEKPPTFFRTNKYTSAFQELIDAYGVATYKEANPAVFTIITFPFLFGVMFGDAGHGVVVLAFAIWMVLQEKQLEAKRIDSEIWQIFFGGRYLILLMSIFSIYTGLIYNDVFSKSLNVFGSSWQVDISEETLLTLKDDMLNPVFPE